MQFPERTVLVHSPGRVGSTSLVVSLKNLGIPWLHTHSLSEARLRWVLERRSAEAIFRADIADSIIARRNLEKLSKVIIPVRSALARNISDFFLTPHRYIRRELFDRADPEEISRTFLRKYPHRFLDDWLEDELEGFFSFSHVDTPAGSGFGWAVWQVGDTDIALVNATEKTEAVGEVFKFLELGAVSQLPRKMSTLDPRHNAVSRILAESSYPHSPRWSALVDHLSRGVG